VVQKDLSSLFTLPLGEAWVAAPPALLAHSEKHHVAHYDQKVGVPFSEYFDDGLMLLDLAAFRANDLAQQLFDFASTRRGLEALERDTFNGVCRGHVKLLERQHELMPECLDIPALVPAASRPLEASVLRFPGERKPWNDLASPWSQHYLAHFRRSPAWSWANYGRLLASRGVRRVKAGLRKPIRFARAAAIREVREATRRHHAYEDRARKDDLDAFAAQYFYLGLATEGRTHGLHVGEPRQEEIVVSLTTIAPRLYDIGTTIESLLHQTLKPDRIVLWLDQTKVSPSDVPLSLQKQMERGLTIRFVEDIGSHTKLVPALREFPNAVVITVDDDVLYPQHLLELLHRAYQADRSKIYCTRARHISVLKTRDFHYTKDWPNLLEEVEGLNVLPLGVGGVLYPPGILDAEVFDLAEQKRLAPKADDIWFKAMSLKKGVVCKRIAVPSQFFPVRPFSQEVSLHHANVHGRENERQIMACFQHYGCWEILGAQRDA
ncbi:MAG TPA: glycosyltransferase, partial [Polyangiaceae bacterium]|nr:glycosyltransferase [Polyangiaceae bacterium]